MSTQPDIVTPAVGAGASSSARRTRVTWYGSSKCSIFTSENGTPSARAQPMTLCPRPEATFTSSASAFNVGIKVLEKLAANAGAYYGPGGKFASHHAHFVKHVRALAQKHPEWFSKNTKWGEVDDIVGGTGGMMKFTPFAGDKDKVNKACRHLFDAGVIAFYCGHGPYHIRMLPPLPVMKEEDWPRVFACIEKGLASAAAEK